ncbi:hypothetical protein M9H77_17760 [Catharanthus roseus]|uniref:Uncharacterized protein n=1 Tax=Catharanthus roseus TaxID=4058 RepID=A0ACC0B5H7_CATRO|nr:hypothetical protein M9H77_17760 [Catharanthus roseus]
MRHFGHDQPMPATCDTHLDLHRLYYHHPEMITLYGIDISRGVYIGNLPRSDTRKFGCQPAGVDRRMMTSRLHEVDEMTIGVLEGPPSSSTQYTSVMRKVQTIIRRCMVSIGGMLDICCTSIARCLQEPVAEHGAHGVKKDARRLPGGGAYVGHALFPPHLVGRGCADPEHGGERGGGSGGWGHGDLGSYILPYPFDSPDLDALTFSLYLTPVAPSRPSGAGTSYFLPDSFDSLDSNYAPPPPSAVGLSFDAPPLLGTSGSFGPHIPISRASSFDSNEHGDDRSDELTQVQQLGFGHRVRSKTTRFTPSDYR